MTLKEPRFPQLADRDGKFISVVWENGNYSIKIDLDSLPEGYILTSQNKGEDTEDSDINSNGVSETVAIADATNTTFRWTGIYKPQGSNLPV